MRRMMAVMLLGLAGLSSAHGQRRPVQRQSNEYVSSDDDGMTRLNTMLAIPERSSTKTEGSGTVSVDELKVPEKAMKEVRESDKALRAGDLRRSTEHLEKALAIYPQAPTWRNGLGSRYVALKQYDAAIGEYEKALALNPNYEEAAENIAATLFAQHRFAEAEPTARRALEMDPTAASSQYLLGCVLVEEGRYSGEATELLQKAKPRYPQADLFLAIALGKSGRVGEAAEALREYVRAGGKSTKVAQEWLAALERREEAGKKRNDWLLADDE